MARNMVSNMAHKVVILVRAAGCRPVYVHAGLCTCGRRPSVETKQFAQKHGLLAGLAQYGAGPLLSDEAMMQIRSDLAAPLTLAEVSTTRHTYIGPGALLPICEPVLVCQYAD